MKADRDSRLHFANTVLANPQTYTSSESSTIQRLKRLGHRQQTIADQIDNDLFCPKWAMQEANSKLHTGKSTCVVQTSPEICLAFIWEKDSHQAKDSHAKDNGRDERKYPNKRIKTINEHHQLYYSCRKMPNPIFPRDWLNRGLWQKIDDDNFIFVALSVQDDDPDMPPNFQPTTHQSAVRGEISAFYSFKRLKFNQTQFTVVLKGNPKGLIPTKLINIAISGALNSTRRAYEYFARDDEIDKIERLDFIDNVMKNAPELTSDESRVITKSLIYAGERAKRASLLEDEHTCDEVR